MQSTPETSKASSSKVAPLPLVDQLVSFSSLSNISQPLATLYTESHTLFTSLQHIVASAIRLPVPGQGLNARGLGVAEVWNKQGKQTSMEGLLGPPGAETVGHIRRLVGMYLEEVVKLRESNVEPEVKAKFDAVYHVLNLAMILYLPQDGRGEGLLGEELLDWVNDVDPGTLPLLCQ
jgi:nuclear pore complex protein Nup85